MSKGQATDLINILPDIDDEHYRYKMPRLLTKVEGKGNGIKTVIPNMTEIAKALERPPTYPTKYFGCELGAQVILNEKDNRYIVNGDHKEAKLQSLLYSFIEKYVLCSQCKNPETELKIEKNDKIITCCKACGEKRGVDMIHKLSTYILKTATPSMKMKDEVKVKRQTDDVQFVESTRTYQYSGKQKAFENYLSQSSDYNLQKIREKLQELKLVDYKAILVLFNVLFDRKIMDQIPIYKKLLSSFVKTAKCQHYLLGAIEIFVSDVYPDLLDKVAYIIRAFYDQDLLYEDSILLWGKKVSRKFVEKDQCKLVHFKARDLLIWLVNAEEDADEDEEESDDDE